MILNHKLKLRCAELSRCDPQRFSVVSIGSALKNIYFLRFL
jgi:hypothetical protein